MNHVYRVLKITIAIFRYCLKQEQNQLTRFKDAGYNNSSTRLLI